MTPSSEHHEPTRSPSTHEVEDAIEDIVQVVRIPEPFRPRVPDPRPLWQEVPHGAAWVEGQLEPLRNELEPLDRNKARRPTERTEPAADGWGIIESAQFILALDCLSRQALALDVDVDHALWSFDDGDDGRFEQWSKSVFVPTAGHAARLGDVMMHGDAVAPGLGSPNVLIGGRPALRTCDSHVCTKTTPVPHAGSGFVATYDRIEINGFAALRVGDYVDEGPHGRNPIVVGCPSVVLGPKPPAVECWQPGEAKPERRPELYPFRWRKGQAGHVKGKVVLGVDVGGPFVRMEGTVTAARLWAEDRHASELPRGDGKVEAWRTTVHGKAARVLGVSDVQLQACPTTRPSETRREDLTVKHEIVELP